MIPRLAAATLAALGLSTTAAATDPPPTFSDPTAIDNLYAPFEAGSVQVFHGRADGVRTTTVISHLPDTRVFSWNGGEVTCCVLEEKEFEAGALVEITTHYLAEDDAGDVRSFGEVSIELEDGVVLGAEEDSWIVGGASQPGDPPGLYAAADPQMFMPADPQLGDVFYQEAFPHSTERLEVVEVGKKVKVPAGKFGWSIKLAETGDDGEDGEDDDDVEYRWVVPGVGGVKEKAGKAKSRLFDTSLLAIEPGA